jgi:replicative DNA helicase
MAAHVSMGLKIPTAFFSLEMSDIALVQRLIASEAPIDSQALRTGLLRASDLQSIMDVALKIYDAPLYIVDMPNMKLLDLRAQARRLRALQKVEIIFVDYLTLISTENYQLHRHEQVAEVSRSLKSLARELDIPVVVLSQVRREVEGKRDHPGRPGLADIRESGSIEQDADVVIFIHQEQDRKDPEANKSDTIPTELIIAKNRNGPTGEVKIMFQKKYTKFASLAYGD